MQRGKKRLKAFVYFEAKFEALANKVAKSVVYAAKATP